MAGSWVGNTYFGDDTSETVKGKSASEQIYGAGGNDTLEGAKGDDILEGGDGNDKLDGGDGDDILYAGYGAGGFVTDGAGKDRLSGGGGDDKIYASSGDFGDIADGGEGIDWIFLDYSAGFQGSAPSINIQLKSSFYVFAGEARGISVQNIEQIFAITSDGNDIISGGKYDDIIWSGKGFDTLDGGAGNDTFKVGGQFDIDGGADIDHLMLNFSDQANGLTISLSDKIKIGKSVATGIEVLTVVGSKGKDILTGGKLADVFDGGFGADRLNGEAGDDILKAGDGNDRVDGGNGKDKLDGGEGHDILNGGAGDDSINAGGAYDTIDLEGDEINGGAGNDSLNSGGGDDVIIGGTGNDQIYSSSGNDRVEGGDGDDTIGVDFNRSLAAVPANGDNDTVIGGEGNDTISAGQLSDKISGDGGNDAFGMSLDTFADTVSGGLGTDTLSIYFNVADLGTDAIETAYSSSKFQVTYKGAVVLTATSIEAFTIAGSQGDDDIVGGTGNDYFTGGLGADNIDGGAGKDTVSYYDKSTSVQLTLNAAKDATVTVGGAIEDTVRRVENVNGGSQNDTLTGDGNANRLAGWYGSDTLTGGGGKDIFYFDSSLFNNDADTITDFQVGEDRIGLNPGIFTNTKPGALADDAFFTGAAAHDKSDRVIYDSSTGNLYFDADGSGTIQSAKHFATLDAGLDLSAADFQLF